MQKGFRISFLGQKTPEWWLADDVVKTEKGGIEIRNGVRVDAKWLLKSYVNEIVWLFVGVGEVNFYGKEEVR